MDDLQMPPSSINGTDREVFDSLGVPWGAIHDTSDRPAKAMGVQAGKRPPLDVGR